MQTRRVPGWLVPLSLPVAVALVYLTALPQDFTLDSPGIVRDHEQLRPGASAVALFFTPYWGPEANTLEYRPVTILTFRFEKSVLGFERARPFAVTNTLLHAGVALLLWMLVRRWTGNDAAAAVAAMLFALHPIATEVVPNLVGRADLLATGFSLGALLAWESRRVDRHWRAASLATALWLVAVLSKESAAVVPAILMLRDVQRFGRASPWRSWLVPVFAGVAWLAWRATILGAAIPPMPQDIANVTYDAPPHLRRMTGIAVWARYVRLMLWPRWMSAEYAFDEIPLVRSAADAWFLAGLLLLGLCIAAIAWSWRRRPVAALGLTLMLAGWLLVSNLPIPIGTIMGDRLMYLPLAGLCAALGTIAATTARPRTVLAAAVVAAAALGMRSHQRAGTWRDNTTLMAQMTRDAPRNGRAWFGHGVTLAHRDPRAAIASLLRADQILQPIEPDQRLMVSAMLATLHLQLAVESAPGADRAALMEQARGWVARALEDEAYRGRRYDCWVRRQDWLREHGRTAATRFGDWQLHVNLANAAYHDGDTAGQMRELIFAAEMGPTQTIIFDRAAAAAGTLPADDAIVALRRLLELNPAWFEGRLALALALGETGRFDEAFEEADRADQLSGESELTPVLMELYQRQLNEAAAAKNPDRMRAIAQRAAERHHILFDLPPDLDAYLNAAPGPSSEVDDKTGRGAAPPAEDAFGP